MSTRWLLMIVTFALLATAQDQPLPASFETKQDNPFLAIGGATATLSDEQASLGNQSLRVSVKGSTEDSWPGIQLRFDPPANWTLLTAAQFDIYVPGDQPLDLSYRIDSAGGGKFFSGARLSPGWNKDLVYQTAAAKDEVDLTQVTGLLLYVRIPREDRTFYLDNLHWVAEPRVDPNRVGSFESDDDQPLFASGCQVERVQEHATDGQWSLRVFLPGSDADSWPGVSLRGGDHPDWSSHETLAFDAFVAGEDEVRLSTRFDTLDGKNVFAEQFKLVPGWNRNLMFNLKALRYQLDLTQVKSFLLYASKPRKDATIYLDRLHWATYSEKFRKLQHVDPTPLLTPTAEEQQRGFILSHSPWTRAVFENDRPTNRAARLQILVTPGESEPLTVTLHALRDLRGVKADISELRGPGGSLAPTAWDVRVYRYLNKLVTYHSDQYINRMPSYLAPLRSPLAIPADRNERFYLRLDCPADTKPGVYQGTVRIQAGDTTAELPLRCRVLPYALPEAAGLLYGEYYRKPGDDDLAARIKADLTDMRQQSMTSVGLCFGVSAESYTVADDQVKFDFQGGTPFELFMETYRQLGFPSPLVLLADTGQTAASNAGKLGDPSWDRVYVDFHLKLAAEAKRRGWPEIYVQPVDEPGWQTDDHRARNVYCLRLLKAAGIKTEEDGPGDNYFVNVAGPFADIWNYNGAVGTAEQVAKAQAEGHLVTFYNNDVEGYRPEVGRWAYGLFNWRWKMAGGYNWEYRGGKGSPYDNLDGADWIHNYLPLEDEPGGPGTGWEGSREGVDDRRYLLLLEQTIAQATKAGGQAAQAARSAAAVLDSLRDRLDSHHAVRGRVRFGATLSPAQAVAAGLVPEPGDAHAYLTGDLKQPNGLTFAESDTIRWMVALETSKLLAVLGEAQPLQLAAFKPVKVVERLVVRNTSESVDAAALPRPSIRVPSLATAPTIDGRVNDDPGWAEATTVSLTLSDGSGDATQPTTVRFGLCDQQLYVAFLCGEDRLDQMQANVKETDGEVWKDDCVEIFLDPGLTEKTFYQVIVNSLGTLSRHGPQGVTWQPEVKAAASRQPDQQRWVAELAIPAGELKLAPLFGLNFGRERRPTEITELCTWSVTGGPFGRPERFGKAVISGDLPGAEPVEPEVEISLSPTWQLATDATTRLTLRTKLDPNDAVRAKLVVAVKGNRQQFSATVPGPLAAKIEAEFGVGDLPPGDYDVTATLTIGGRTVTDHAVLTRVPSP